jgi:hypothetical protein
MSRQISAGKRISLGRLSSLSKVYRHLQEMGIFVTHEFRVERSRWARGWVRCGMGDAIECTIIENLLYPVK